MDHVDAIIEQWGRERPDLNVAAMAVIGRIGRLSRIFSREMEKTFAEHGLNGASFDVLATLRRAGGAEGLSPSALLKQTMVTSGTMTHRIDQLEKAGLVKRRKDEVDGRSVHIQLTDKGRAVIDRAVGDHVVTQERLVASLSKGQRGELTAVLRQLLEGFE